MTRTAPATRKIRAGYYQVTDAQGAVWDVVERRVPAEYGGGWAWYAEQMDTKTYLDPLPTLRRCKAAIAKVA